MLDFIMQNFNNKCCKKNQPKQLYSQQNATVPVSAGTVVEIDYEKLVNAIVDANDKIKKQEKENEAIKFEEQRENWKKTLLGQNYDKDIEDSSNWDVFWGLMRFKKENAIGDNAIFALFQLVNACLLWIYEITFYGAMILGFIFGCHVCKDIISNWSNITIYLQAFGCAISKFLLALAMIIFPIIVARIIRVARLQVNNIKDKQFALNIFNALITFTALIIAIITMLVT